jgi:hypothetical protein
MSNENQSNHLKDKIFTWVYKKIKPNQSYQEEDDENIKRTKKTKKKTRNIKPKTNQGDITKINKGTPLIFEKIMGGVVATTIGDTQRRSNYL